MATLSVDVPQYVIWRSAAIWSSTFAKKYVLPDFAPFYAEPRLEILDITKSTSVVGPSQAAVGLAAGPPVSPEIAPEDGHSILTVGDRVAIGLPERGGRIRWIFGGYVTTASILIDGKSESAQWRIHGPEWAWGVGGNNVGTIAAVYGQYRRTASADDTYIEKGGKTSPDAIKRFSDLPAIFNPQGRGNMTTDDVTMTKSSARVVDGRIWEEPDRLKGSAKIAVRWSALQAAKTLTTAYNDPEQTRIDPPKDWAQVAMKAEDIIREVSVDGLCLYDALKAVFGSRFGFYIDPRPGRIQGKNWGPFQLVFFSRSRNVGSIRGDLRLNKRGTSMLAAAASVKRMEAARDVTKSVNRVVVGGKYVRHVRLVFWGGASKTVAATAKNYRLWPAWNTTEVALADYAATDAAEGQKSVNVITAVRDAAPRQDWLQRFATTGIFFATNSHIFRTFVWNESGDYRPDKTVTFADGVTAAYVVPDLSDIAAPQSAEEILTVKLSYLRRRRPLLDTIFKTPGDAGGDWQRKPPTLYIAIAPTAADANFNSWKWRKVPENAWQPEKYRGGFTITVEDIAAWKPFEKHERLDPGSSDIPGDPRTFATLLNTGRLRLCYEGSIELDHAMERTAMPTSAGNGSAHLRETFVRAGASYVKTLLTADGFNSPSGLTPSTLDQGDEAFEYASLLRDAGQEQKVNASLLVEADWPEQALGAHISGIGGSRQINLSSVPGGRGAQIVAVKLDTRNNCWEYLTESAAMALAEKDRRRLASGTKVFVGSKDEQERRSRK